MNKHNTYSHLKRALGDDFRINSYTNVGSQFSAGLAKNKITTSTKFFGYSEIKVDDIDVKINVIVQDVLRMQAGLSDTMIPMHTLQ